MPAKKENTRKVAGNAKKAEAAAVKQASADAHVAAQEDDKWSKGAKSNAKKEEAAAKQAEAATKKAERERQLADEEATQRATPKGANKKVAEKKTKGPSLDLSQLDEDSSNANTTTNTALNASGIDNALDALSLTTANALQVDRHPERRFKAAYKAYEERRLPEIDAENPGLRKNQRVEIARKEFERSEENPFNQAGNVAYDAGREEINSERKRVRDGVEGRLGAK